MARTAYDENIHLHRRRMSCFFITIMR